MNGYDVYFVGVGGQGILTIGEILAEASFRARVPVNFYPTKGMAQRGGFVKAQLRIGRERIGPNIPERGADLIISMELSETLKALRFMKPGGEVLLYGFVWSPTDVLLGRAPYPSLEKIQEVIKAAGGTLYFIDPARLPRFENAALPDNIFVLGAALGKTRMRQLVKADKVSDIVRTRWKKGSECNLFAFEQGLLTNG